ncbi:hypothetical protein DPEC_G00094300 [Dallia pectoralis]|uniref:Uncharacterized protein n=1 Tax=Dallia pectoralis TaxID=75939 RepID=A0ACC2H1Q3_DALPE|nr:hypothetical protein DPEC_G00094300 [Dallia pectoralis]
MLKTIGQVLFSSGLQNPKFASNEEKQATDYEVRTYETTNWISTTVTGMDQDAAMSTGFKRLFAYIQGNNHKKEKVEMTAPVTCLVDPGAGPACETTFIVSFYIPEQHQTDPPQPGDPDVYLENRKEFTAFVRTYAGFSNTQKSREELLKLLESLQKDGASYKNTPYYVCGYDSPFKLTNRRNEVWILQNTEQG